MIYWKALNGAYGVIHLGAYQAPNLARIPKRWVTTLLRLTTCCASRPIPTPTKTVIAVEHGGIRLHFFRKKLLAQPRSPPERKTFRCRKIPMVCRGARRADLSTRSHLCAEKMTDQQPVRESILIYWYEVQRALAQSANARQRILDLYRRARRGGDLPVSARGEVYRSPGIYRRRAKQLA